MDWIDYREELGIGFNDTDKTKMFTTNIINYLRIEDARQETILDIAEYFTFCLMTGTAVRNSFTNKDIITTLLYHENSFIEFLAYCVAIINSKKTASDYGKKRRDNVISAVETFLKKAHISFDILRDNEDNYFIFPKGAEELDDALVSEPLKWLENYPKAHKTFCNALKQYSDGVYPRDVADNLRKALEEFLQEFLGNEKNLENNKDEFYRYLGNQGVDAGIIALYQPLINSYKNINDRIVKHNDKIDPKLLEFILYQTGLLIRMAITVKNSEE